MEDNNVKIKIAEKDNTTPTGAVTDSTDIAFIPGFSIKTTAPVNIPTLCTSVKQFEELFGASPKVLTEQDVESYTSYGFIAGDYDRSYVFAKELLYADMPVLYVNMANEFDETTAQYLTKNSIGTISGSSIFKLTATEDSDPANFEVTTTSSHISSVSLEVPLKITINKSNTEGVKKYTAIRYKPVVNIGDNDRPAEVQDFRFTYTIPQDNTHVVCESNNGDTILFSNDHNLDYTDIIVKLTITFKLGELTADTTEKFYFSIADVSNVSPLATFYATDAKFKEILTEISDKSVYSVKYITSGGYPSIVSASTGSSLTTMFAAEMINAAKDRGDAVALIDCLRMEQVNPDTAYTKMTSALSGLINREYGACMYPWAKYNCSSPLPNNTSVIDMPASFAYLKCMATAIKTSPNWLAIAGVTRGKVPGIISLQTPNGILSNTSAENMQPRNGSAGKEISINCITNVRPYGLTIWGNRTLKDVDDSGAVALNFLNIRNMLSDIKKLLYTTSKSLMFEQNSDRLWLSFKNGISPLLNQIKSGNGISDYQIIKSTTKSNGESITKGELVAVVRIYPIYAVEYFDLTVEINDQDVVVS